MALARSFSLLSPSPTPSRQFQSLSSRTPTFFPKLLLLNPRNSTTVLSCSSPRNIPVTEQEVLKAVAESDEKTLPCVRTYENDLARLSLVGAVGFEQALTAAAADGGEAADEHIDSGAEAMVVETVFPGASDQNGTVSTRLFLPARKVKEKANKLRRSLTKDILSSTTSRNILAMTFKQVVLEHLWNFELVLFRPGTERNMEDLESPREVSASFILGASDEWVISALAEVICIAALQNTESNFLDSLLGKTSNNLFHWFRKPKRIISKDSSVIMHKLFENDFVENANSLLENFNSMKENFRGVKVKQKYPWWTPSALYKLEKIGGPEFSAWTNEYVPAYRMEIDCDKLKNVKIEGWRRSAENRWEVLLTHSQMVGLADILDMYFEDIYSLPSKRLSCSAVADYANLSNKKRSSALLKMLAVTLASGSFLIAIAILSQFWFPLLSKGGNYYREHRSLPSSEDGSAVHQCADTMKLEAICVLAVKKIKDALGWPGDILTEAKVGAWIGEIPDYLKINNLVWDGDSSSYDNPTKSAALANSDVETKLSGQDIASYQVVFSMDGKVVGFQPTSRVGVNHWASNPLAKELYGGRKLSPGFMEPGLKIELPNELAVIELLMSANKDSYFALARPGQ